MPFRENDDGSKGEKLPQIASGEGVDIVLESGRRAECLPCGWVGLFRSCCFLDSALAVFASIGRFVCRSRAASNYQFQLWLHLIVLRDDLLPPPPTPPTPVHQFCA